MDFHSPLLERGRRSDSGGHWIVAAAEADAIDRSLQDKDGRLDPLDRQDGRLAGHEVTTLWLRRYEGGGGYHGGHVAIRWTQAGVDRIVSLHGYHNLARTRAIASALIDAIDAERSQDRPPAPARGSWQRLMGSESPIPGPQNVAAVATGERVVLIAGVDNRQADVSALTVDPESLVVSRAARPGLWWRFGYTAVAAGERVIVWGGCCGPAGRGDRAPGAVYDAVDDRWQPIRSGPAGARAFHTAVWTGSEMIVWGGTRTDGKRVALPGGAAYDLSTHRWRRIAPAPIEARYHHVSVWTGEEMLVWGGVSPRTAPGRTGLRLHYDGAAYDPARDRWRILPPVRFLGILQQPSGRTIPFDTDIDLQAAWTGRRMIVWNGTRGALYAPPRRQWTRIPAPPKDIRPALPGGRIVWTGEELLVWGGSLGGGAFAGSGAAYRPDVDSWHELPAAPITGRDRHAAVWTGAGMLVWGGCCQQGRYQAGGGVYSPLLPDRELEEDDEGGERTDDGRHPHDAASVPLGKAA